MFQKIEVSRVRLADQVYAQIVRAIDNGQIEPAERIVQEKLAEQLQVSRTPIREALFRLEQEGVLVAAEHGGFSIRMATAAEVRDIYDARQAIEGHCAAMLAEKANADDLAHVSAAIEENESASPANVSQYYAANRKIHRAFVEATGNSYLLEMFDAMWNRSLSFNAFRLMPSQDLGLTLKGHSLLLDPIRAGDPALAMNAMRNHILDGLNLHLAALSKLDEPTKA